MTASTSPKILGVIPARYNSSRFPAKMLALIAGKPLLQYTYDNAKEFPVLDDLIIATDDGRIYDQAVSFGAKVVMTSPDCPTGTDRIAEVIERYPDYARADIVVNLQGDAPCLHNEIVEKIVSMLVADKEATMATAACRITSQEAALNPSIVKCIMDKAGNALYFSRALIPASHSLQYNPNTPYYQHLGIYAYRTSFLSRYAALAPTTLQMSEDLEQLKILENGYRIKIAVVDQNEIPDVNTPEDLAKVEPILCRRNTSSSLAASVRR